MSKSNFLKSMKNVSLNDKNRNFENKFKTRDHWQVEIEIPASDKIRLQKVMNVELEYYNRVNENILNKIRTSPSFLLNINEKLERLYSQVSYLGYNIRPLYLARGKTLENFELPEQLMEFKELLLLSDKNGNRNVSESFLLLLEAVGYNNGLHPQTRKNMSLEILKFYKEQSKIVEGSNKVTDEYAYKSSLLFLENMDRIRKRHIQLPREAVSIAWLESENHSKIKIPYLGTTIKIENINLYESGWNILVIHQEPGGYPTSKTPWIAEFRKDKLSYLIKYIDQKSPYIGSSYYQAKRF